MSLHATQAAWALSEGRSPMTEQATLLPQKTSLNLRWIAVAAVITAIALWVASLALPVWETRSNNSGEWGTVIGALPAVIGFLGILVLCPAWSANVLLIPAFVTLFKGRRVGIWLSFAALVIAASAYAMPGIYGDNDEAVIVGRH